MISFSFRLILSLSVTFLCYSTEQHFDHREFHQVWANFLSNSEEGPHRSPLDFEQSLEYEFYLLDEFSDEQEIRQRPYLPDIDRFESCRPYRGNHVTLLDGTEMSASFIYLGENNTNYHNFIATQAPFKQNRHLFWQMVLDNQIDQIIMLTECFEDPLRELCHPYWPSHFNEKLILSNHIEVTLLHQQELLSDLKENILIRQFHIRKHDLNRVITHYWYRNWPDNTAPCQAETIKTLIKTVENDKNEKGSQSPILVHCAAGVGRTGVFVTLYHFMQRLKYQDEKIPVFHFIAYLRWLRPYMVGMESQYKFCHREVSRLFDL